MRTRVRRAMAVLALVALALGVAASSGPFPASAQRPAPPDVDAGPPAEYAPGEVLVRFRPGVATARAEAILAEHGAGRLRRVAALDVHVLRLPDRLEVERAVEVFSRLPEVEFAEPNYILRIAEAPDPGLGNQWAPQKIQAPDAWAITTGNPGTVIAIVDTGVDYGHGQLAPNMWANPGEIGGNGLDDDGNGYVDDVRGWDVYNNDADPLDDHSHGTHVAGIAAAVADDDANGMVGICPSCHIMAVKVLGADGSATLDKVASGIVYATDASAQVINLSLGGAAGGTTLRSAVDYAWGRGVLIAAAAGNDGLAMRSYPAAYANAMAVAATDSSDHHVCFSNYYEDYISAAAPGLYIFSTTPRDTAGQDTYSTYSGTSMATPHVAGLAGLLFSLREGLTNAEVRARIESSAVDLGVPGTDPFFGAGRIDALRAVTGDASPTTPPSDGLPATDETSTSFASARKLARDANGVLHLVWHTEATEYRVVYATSGDDGATWSAPVVIFSSTAATYHPALAVDDTHLYVVFPSLEGANYYRVWFTRKPLASGSWEAARPLSDGTYDAVRPSLYLDPTNGRLHVVASGMGDTQAAPHNAPTIYYTASGDQGSTWVSVTQVAVGGSEERSRYGAVHANGNNVYVVGRTVEFKLFGLLPVFRVSAVRSSDGGATWTSPTVLASYNALYASEYGVSLAGVGDRLFLAYEHDGAVYVRRNLDGTTWQGAESIGPGYWPSIVQAADGQAWAIWEGLREGGSHDLWLRHYTGTAWEPTEMVSDGNVATKVFRPNLKLGLSGGLLEWVGTSCNGAPYRVVYGSRQVSALPVDQPPTVAITQPLSDEWIRGTYRVLVSAGDDRAVSAVLLSIDGVPLDITGDREGVYYYHDWTTTTSGDGEHTLQARATDDVGQSTDSVAVSVTVDNTPPTVEMTSPSDGDAVSGTVAITATAQDGGSGVMQVEFLVDDVSVGVDTDGTDGWSAGWSSEGTADGVHQLVAIATDAIGNGGSVSVSVTSDNTPPEVSITSPEPGASLSGVADVIASASDQSTDVAKVQFLVDGMLLATDANGSDGWSTVWDTTQASDGTHSVTAEATDTAGNTGASDAVSVTVRNQTMHVVNLDGSTAQDKAIWTASVAITIHDGDHQPLEGAVVQGAWSGGFSGSASCTTEGNGQCSVTSGSIHKRFDTVTFSVTDLAHESHAYDPAANDGTSIQVTNGTAPVDHPPQVSIAAPADGATIGGEYRILVTATDDNGINKVELQIDGSSPLEITANWDGTHYYYDWDTTTVADGGHTVQAHATDSIGQPGESGVVNVTVSNGGGMRTMSVKLELTSKAAGPNLSATAIVRVADDDTGDPVEGATVSGKWSGTYNNDVNGVTGSDGKVTFSVKLRGDSASFTFEATGVTKEGYGSATLPPSQTVSLP